MRVGVENPVAVASHHPPLRMDVKTYGVDHLKVAFLKGSLLRAAFAIVRHFGYGIRPIAAALDKGVPGLHAAGLEGGHEVPQRRPGDVVGETGIPGDGDPERQVLVEIEVAAELTFHEGKRPRYCGACRSDFVYRMGRFELHPVDASLLAISLQTRNRILQRPVEGIASVALRHHHEIRIEFVLHVDRCPVARNRLVERHDLNTGALRLALPFYRLVVNAYPGNAGADALPHHAAHGHDAAVTRVAVHDHRDRHAVGYPPGDRHAFGHRRGADIGKTGIGTDHPAGTDEQRLATGLLHNTGVRRSRRVQDSQNLVPAMDQLLKLCRF